MAKTNFTTWLERQYVAWQNQDGKRKSIKSFAEWLDLPQPVLSHYLNGSRSPTNDNLEKIAVKLGDEAYDALDRQRPDPLLRKLKLSWCQLSDDQKVAIDRILGDEQS